MHFDLPLDKMTVADKLRAMEQIWSDLLRSPEEVPSPAWHADVLQARERRARECESKFNDCADAKRRIRDKTR